MPRITELPALAQATSGDVIPIVDDAGNITKKVTADKVVPDGSVVTNQLANGAVTTAKIGDGQVTASKIDYATLIAPKIGTIAGTTLNSTGNKTITGVGFTPKLVKFTIIQSSTTVGSIFGYGSMTTTSQFATAGTFAASAGATVSSTTACILRATTGSTTPVMSAAYVSMNPDGFTINVTIAGNYDVAYEAYP